MTNIKSIISGLFYKNEEFMLSFFNQIEDEHNISLFLLDYHGEYDDKTLISELDNLIKLLFDLDYIELIKVKGYNNFFIVKETDQKFIFETKYIFRRKENMKSKKLSNTADKRTFEKLNMILDENLNNEQLHLVHNFFKHLREKSIFTDLEEYESQMRPAGEKSMIDDVDIMDVIRELQMVGVIEHKNIKNGKAKFSIPYTDIVFTINTLQMSSSQNANALKKANAMATKKRKGNSKIRNIVKEKNKTISKPKPKPFEMTEKEIEDRALSVIESAKANSTDEVINIFEKISLPFNGANYKRQLFEKIFELAEVEGEWRDDIGYVIFSKKRTKRTVVSHIDLISPFNRGFAKGKVYTIEDGKLIGALDNTFTNAVVINSILNGQSDDTTYLFTLDEETTQYAIRDYMKLFGNEQFIINLDITNEGMKNNMAIEYDEPSWEICKQVSENMDSPFFTMDRECDDMDEVMKANGFGFSYCVPSGKGIHSYNNYTYIDKIKPYMDGLEFLIYNLDLSSYKQNIKHISIKKALKCKNLKKLAKKNVRKVKVGSSKRVTHHYDSVSDYTGGIQSSMIFDDETSYEDEETSYQDYEHEINKALLNTVLYIAEDTATVNYHVFEGYVGEKLYLDQFMSREDIVHHSNERTFSVLKAADLILEVENNSYVFNRDYVGTTKFKILNIAKIKAHKLDFTKFAKFMGGVNSKFSMLDLAVMHVDKDDDEVSKFQDFTPFIRSLEGLNLIDISEGSFNII